MRVAVVGGGINGVMTAWALARAGCTVELFERRSLMGATSSASTKMLHGGLRYLEHGHFGLVREALQERAWWIREASHLARPFELILPIYRGGRSRWLVGAGIKLYECLALGSGFPSGGWSSPEQMRARLPSLNPDGLLGGCSYWDAQMDDRQLGLWAAEQARKAGVRLHEHAPVERLSTDGALWRNGGRQVFDRVVNVAGPWAKQLLEASGIPSAYGLTLVQGSHLLIARCVPCGCVLQVPGERRLVFLLPYGELALLGTTEVPQALPVDAQPSEQEVEYLKGCYNHAFNDFLHDEDIVGRFAGLRPIVTAGHDYSAASRESVIERRDRLVNVFGGKWTTSRALADKVAKLTLT